MHFFAAHLFESKYIRFENTHSIPNAILRLLLGVVIFLALNAALKALFGLIPLFPLLFRTIRYAVIVFTLMGLYPYLFRFTDRLFRKR